MSTQSSAIAPLVLAEVRRNPVFPNLLAGNSPGRPKSKLFTRQIRRTLMADAGNGETNLEHIVRAMVLESVEQGNVRAAEFLRDTVDGRPSPDSDASSGPSINVNVMTMGAVSAEADGDNT